VDGSVVKPQHLVRVSRAVAVRYRHAACEESPLFCGWAKRTVSAPQAYQRVFVDRAHCWHRTRTAQAGSCRANARCLPLRISPAASPRYGHQREELGWYGYKTARHNVSACIGRAVGGHAEPVAMRRKFWVGVALGFVVALYACHLAYQAYVR